MSRPSAPAVSHAWLGRTARAAGARQAPQRPSVAQLRFALPRPQHALVCVHDSNGRVVRTLHDGTLEPGEHVSSWDGQDDLGASLAAGSYTLRLDVDRQPLTSRVITLR